MRYVAIEAVDGRTSIDSLARLRQEKLAEDPFPVACLCFRRPISPPGAGWGEAGTTHIDGAYSRWPSRLHGGQFEFYLRALAEGGRREARRHKREPEPAASPVQE